MEDQFIIRTPESIREKVNNDVKNGVINKLSIKMISAKEGILTYENKTYTGYIADLPCIIESHKTLDNRQFIKIADISKIFVFSDDASKAQETAEEASLSGITPPMKYVKTRRFRKRLTKAPIIEEIEKAVSSLLQKDKEAIRIDVQLINKSGSESEEDVSSLAAEIELNLLESEKNTQNSIEYQEAAPEELKEKESHLKEILAKIEEKKEQINKISNPILKKRFQENIQQLMQEKEEIEEEIRKLTDKTG
ncbi:transcription initiation factor TFIID subunit 7 [Nematocida minor]|uniref:transcription initiation factor TFIID subunit 7 n=1 Tax=Nematocida minor TaxID=1912983 RepID=UPI00221FE886|nr:transcription initiation factor TFIID subunit 7 [Nematocida minor]KAI5192201.1 transcription initiation factor TFIID subunit 7 [Nematocida minor]